MNLKEKYISTPLITVINVSDNMATAKRTYRGKITTVYLDKDMRNSIETYCAIKTECQSISEYIRELIRKDRPRRQYALKIANAAKETK